jgi:hypothetical protein
VLRAMAIRRDVIWPIAAGLVSGRELKKRTFVAAQNFVRLRIATSADTLPLKVGFKLRYKGEVERTFENKSAFC